MSRRSNYANLDAYAAEEDVNYALYEEQIDRKNDRRSRLSRRQKNRKPVRRSRRGFDEGGYEWAA